MVAGSSIPRKNNLPYWSRAVFAVHPHTGENMKILTKPHYTPSVFTDYNGALLYQLYLAGERNFERADLRGVDLRNLDLQGINLRGANLSGALFISSNLQDSDLEGADLSWAHLCDANLTSVNLKGANLFQANLDGTDIVFDNP